MGCGGTRALENGDIKLHPEIFLKREMIFSTTDKTKRKTKIVCTIGPVSQSVETLTKLLDMGMGIARLNFSHGTHDFHRITLSNLKEALSKRPGLSCAVMLDTKGPEIRTGFLENGKSVEVLKDQILEITTDYNFKGNSNKISCSYENLPKKVKVGGQILIADGSLTCEIMEILSDGVKVKLLNSGTIGERKNMNLPKAKVDIPTLTDKDYDDLLNFGIKEKVDMIAASFIRKAENIKIIREVLGEEGKSIMIISKIENEEGLLNYPEILQESDGIMVARGDMGMEIPLEKVFIAQKYMIDLANLAGKPVITATQMLESMVKNPRPTRAEVTDIANAVIDGTDCVMLSGETANGSYPVESVEIMGKICVEAEADLNYLKIFSLINEYCRDSCSIREKACSQLVGKAEKLKAGVIIVWTENGRMARLVAKYKPRQPILAVCKTEMTIRQLNISRGVSGYKPMAEDEKDIIEEVIKYCEKKYFNSNGSDTKILIHLFAEEDEEKEFKNKTTVVNI